MNTLIEKLRDEARGLDYELMTSAADALNACERELQIIADFTNTRDPLPREITWGVHLSASRALAKLRGVK